MRHKKNRITSKIDTNELVLVEVVIIYKNWIHPENKGYRTISFTK